MPSLRAQRFSAQQSDGGRVSAIRVGKSVRRHVGPPPVGVEFVDERLAFVRRDE
jgi:hypothetical protein